MLIRRVLEHEIEALTSMLNRAYAEHAARGIQMMATHQGPEITRDRIRACECFVGIVGEQLVATVTLVPPHAGRSVEDAGCPTYARAGVAKIQQFAVAPEHRKRGYGSRMMDHAEQRARELGAVEIALDTAMPAIETQAYYLRRGYEIVDRADWRPNVNYESVVLSRRLDGSATP